LCDDWNIDAPSYTFTKLNPDDEKDRTTVNSYFLWEGDFGGKPVPDGKIFK
jgi:elongation factor 1-gamma